MGALKGTEPPATQHVAGKLECPFVCKVEVSLWAAARHDDQPRSDRLMPLQDQIGAGEGHRSALVFSVAIVPSPVVLLAAVCCRVGIKAARCFRKSSCRVTSMSPRCHHFFAG
ncbi:hypothetical protein ELI49_32525 [Rhizobium ruizarguesonis]|uniref:Uncharacterized protein n=1 Tax=Rhizobium ruizarguesonis TaxID=2081791 RepID=A0AAE8TZ41_9HYPH|nr:hypothetical protein [Rhizobium leguminosarum bv. viciae]TAT97261.1 hypothetical protein ELI49_32525 [Rhizobium ruizarguesonis]TAU93981.1 hypothetical protein ELI39_35000 [Rhizobium ruizarguesonis]TBA72602.1 hypothetical protein ELH56_33565 [Rhizobium ruizarguesonis]TBB37664.1 hypothetical protein ELH49_34155 [Rhizobium ruizarguesonis]